MNACHYVGIDSRKHVSQHHKAEQSINVLEYATKRGKIDFALLSAECMELFGYGARVIQYKWSGPPWNSGAVRIYVETSTAMA